ncbi:hypothetical protein FS842_011404 [Serendipita sp. 407]|nr:hypothetical protein FS842_011404 [Serendipita sp. 407]
MGTRCLLTRILPALQVYHHQRWVPITTFLAMFKRQCTHQTLTIISGWSTGQLPYSKFMSQSLQFGVQSQGTLHAHRRDVSVGTTSTYSGFSPLERRSIHPSPPVKWLVEESSAKLPRQSNPITLLGHPNGLAPRFPVFSDVNNHGWDR